jgi:4'-phosphopantetheinyl transferase
VLVWTVPLAVEDAMLARLRSLLDEAESARADRFATPPLRGRYAAARGTLRLIVGHYAGIEARLVAFTLGPRGKPALAGDADLEFNLSHAGDVALIALARRRPVGVDIEAVARADRALGVATHVFSGDERQALQALPPAARPDAFTRMWTRKEAYVKALGMGFAYPTRSFTVSLRATDDDALLHDDATPGALSQWRVRALPAPAGFHAALAAAGRDWTVSNAGPLSPAEFGL